MALTVNLAQINAASKGNNDLRESLTSLHLAVQSIYSGATAPLKKVDATSTKNLGPPGQCGLSVTGANGSFTVTITLPQQASGSSAPANATNAPIYQQLQSATAANFTAGLITYPTGTGTSYVFPNPGATLYWRLRSSYDQNTWNNYSTQPGAVSAGLQSSAASEPATALNQTNFARVDSIGAGSSATIRVYGSGGVGTSWTSGSGTNTKVIPAGTIMNVTYGTTQFVAWTGSQYQVKSSLSQVLPDSWTPVGSTSVISNGAGLVLPSIEPVITSGHIIGYNVTAGGNDITGTLTFVVNDSGGGTGATVGPATITSGVLTALGAGNPGANYTGATTVTPSGGVSGGVAGGGGATGNNGGRLFGLTVNGV
jgi:hypothetical protein